MTLIAFYEGLVGQSAIVGTAPTYRIPTTVVDPASIVQSASTADLVEHFCAFGSDLLRTRQRWPDEKASEQSHTHDFSRHGSPLGRLRPMNATLDNRKR